MDFVYYVVHICDFGMLRVKACLRNEEHCLARTKRSTRCKRRCNREHSKFPENLQGSEATKWGRGCRCPPYHGVELFCFSMWYCVFWPVHTSEGIFTYFYTLFLCLFEYWVTMLLSYCNDKTPPKKLSSFWKFPEIQKFLEMWHVCGAPHGRCWKFT